MDKSERGAMLLVALLHAALILAMIHIPAPEAQNPILPITVTLLDLSASDNSSISSAASSDSTPVQKTELQKQEAAMDVKPARIKKQVKPAAKPSPKTSAPVPPKASAPVSPNPEPLPHNSETRKAVLAEITPAQFDAAYLQNPKPVYPSLSRRMGEQGNVLLLVHVGENGQSESVKLKSSSGFSRLDDAAVKAVSGWRFIAAKQGGRLIASWVNVPVKFVLE